MLSACKLELDWVMNCVLASIKHTYIALMELDLNNILINLIHMVF